MLSSHAKSDLTILVSNRMSNQAHAILFFLQMAFILCVIRGVGSMARRLGQPQVVGEMIAGVILGPSLLGALAPEFREWMFPASSVPILYVIAQLGLVLYMFVVGLEFNVVHIRTRMRSAVAVSIVGIAVPFCLGGLFAVALVNKGTLFTQGVSSWEAALFTGAAMSITAFPMLARILLERGLAGTSLGTLALAAGSCDDAIAWCLLAVVVASFSFDPLIAVFAVGGGLLYGVTVLSIGRKLLGYLDRAVAQQGRMRSVHFSVVLICLMVGAWYTDYVGIYAVFGAFILGIAMPRGIVSTTLRERIEPLTTNLLLPLFFIYSGLNTNIIPIMGYNMLPVTIGAILIACVGKGVACWGAARIMGEDNKTALTVGALMNARGLMELILLNIGLERSIITPTFFSIMVVMAVVTTLMATPLVILIRGRAEEELPPSAIISPWQKAA